MSSSEKNKDNGSEKGFQTEEFVQELLKGGFPAIEKAILACKCCPLYATASNKVTGKGSHTPKVLFIGEAPGKNEDEKGIPFCGRAGKELDKMVEYMGLSEKDWAVINTLKCRPPGNRNPSKEELECCKPFLIAQIRLLDPLVIILLGNTAERAYCPGRKLEWGIPELINRRQVLKLYHPAALIYTRSKIEVQKKLIDKNRKLWM